MNYVLVGAAAVAFVIVFLQLLTLKQAGAVDPAAIQRSLAEIEKDRDRLEKSMRDDFARNRQESSESGRSLREELQNSVKSGNDSTLKSLAEFSRLQQDRLSEFSKRIDDLNQANQLKLDGVRNSVEERLSLLQTSNSQKLDEMRQTVDEKLQGTLEKRLAESFKLVSDRLEQVHQGLGEMKVLTNGVGDLKRVLSNVKARGTWGEVQLGNLLEQFLHVDQYEKNVATNPSSNERVEFAIKLPGRSGSDDEVIWIPIDAKFPGDVYERVVIAAESADPEGLSYATKALEVAVRTAARDIHDKYVCPPHTTDFAIMFLPTEGLYAEVLRHPSLSDTLQRDYRICITGPTTLVAFVSSLQLGFRTLAIEKRSSEVWTLLGSVKTEFGRFGSVLESIKKKLDQASTTIDQAAVHSRSIERKLRDVETLPGGQAFPALAPVDSDDAGLTNDDETL